MGAKLSSPTGELPSDRTFLITGANAGIGFITAKKIAQLGGRVVITCRTEEKAREAIEQMQKEHQEEMAAKKISSQTSVLNIQFMILDLGSIKSTLLFVQKYKSSGLPLHVLICNAGIMNFKREITEDGFEAQFQVNYLSHFLLTLNLLPLLKETSPESRIINVSSLAHKYHGFAFDNLQSEKAFNYPNHYGNSKLCQIMNTHVMAEKLKDPHVSVFVLHPGVVKTSLYKNSGGFSKFFLNTLIKLHLFRTPEEGAMTTLVAALDPTFDGMTALYFDSCKIKNSSAISRNKGKQAQLWKYSLECLREHLTDDVLKEVGETLSNITGTDHRQGTNMKKNVAKTAQGEGYKSGTASYKAEGGVNLGVDTSVAVTGETKAVVTDNTDSSGKEDGTSAEKQNSVDDKENTSEPKGDVDLSKDDQPKPESKAEEGTDQQTEGEKDGSVEEKKKEGNSLDHGESPGDGKDSTDGKVDSEATREDQSLVSSEKDGDAKQEVNESKASPAEKEDSRAGKGDSLEESVDAEAAKENEDDREDGDIVTEKESTAEAEVNSINDNKV